MNLQKINNFAFKSALVLALAGVSALLSLSVIQAKDWAYPKESDREFSPERRIMNIQAAYDEGKLAGKRDSQVGAFRPCFLEGYRRNPDMHKAFLKGYFDGYLGSDSNKQ